jgi:hypothetical protein
MTNQDFTTTFSVEQGPEKVFNAITNVRGWWSEEIEGATDKLGAEFLYHYEVVHRCKMKITEFVPGQRIVWLVLDHYFKFTEDKAEWTDTRVIFEVTQKGENRKSVSLTRVSFPNVNVSMSVQTHGALISMPVYGV